MVSPEENNALNGKICCSCGELKNISAFFRNCGREDGYEARCKQCKRENKKCVPRRGKKKLEKIYYEPNVQDDFTWLHPTKEDWINMFYFLEMKGYDISKNIHEQFCEKYNLKPIKKRYDKNKSFSAKDLGIV